MLLSPYRERGWERGRHEMVEIVNDAENSRDDGLQGNIARYPLSQPLPLSGERSMNSMAPSNFPRTALRMTGEEGERIKVS